MNINIYCIYIHIIIIINYKNKINPNLIEKRYKGKMINLLFKIQNNIVIQAEILDDYYKRKNRRKLKKD